MTTPSDHSSLNDLTGEQLEEIKRIFGGCRWPKAIPGFVIPDSPRTASEKPAVARPASTGESDNG